MSATPITDLVSQMLAADVPHDIVVLAVRTAELLSAMSAEKSAELSAETPTDRRRRLDRERKATARGGGKSADMSADASADLSADKDGNVRGMSAETDSILVLEDEEVKKDKRNQVVKKVSKNIVGSDNSADMSAGAADKLADKKRTDEDFEHFWKGYPRTPTMSKKETRAAWDKLTKADRDAVLIAGPKYARWLAGERAKRADTPAVHAVRFITQRRFEGFNDPPDPETTSAPLGEPLFKHGDFAPASAGRIAGYIYWKSDTPEWDRWVTYNRKQGRRSPAQDKFGGWFFPTAAPPE